MYNVHAITNDIFWIGASDRRLNLFENIFPIERGISYNSYLIKDTKTALMDTVDSAVSKQFFENLKYVLDGKALDYVVVNHMEPDHCAVLQDVISRYPDVKVVGNAKTFAMIKQFFGDDLTDNTVVVKEGDVLSLGSHELTFVTAPMVHWPEVMVAYDSKDKVLFSADAFGTFGALNGNIFADQVNFDRDWLNDARRYYANIVGKYGIPVQGLLKKASALDIKYLCPLHGPVWRENLDYFIGKYDTWSKYQWEEKGVAIFYASMYGNTASVADTLAGMVSAKGVKQISVYDISITDISVLISEMFRVSHLVFASPTYNGDVYPKMDSLLTDMKNLAVQNKTVALIDNGSWAPLAGKKMKAAIEEMKNMTVIEPVLTVSSSLKENQLDTLESMAEEIANTIK